MKKTKNSMNPNKTAKNKTSDFPIVGIGASAGGLEALELFFKNMPNNNGMAFVIIQHLDPTHKGIMPELLQRITAMKVMQATDHLKILPDHVYVIPPNKSMSLLSGSLYLFEPKEVRGLRLPIDYFFRSMANDRNEKSIGVILSGMGSDGSAGLKAIKENNGLILIQSPNSSKYNGMPTSASETVIADIIAPPEELAAKLIACLSFTPSERTETRIASRSSLDKIIILLREFSGHDFSLYKRNTLIRRIERRKNIHQIDKIHDYFEYSQTNPAEVEILFKELLIGVTRFFRDTEVWTELKEKTIPALINELPEGYVMRAWISGCSTGEEAYSLAIVFQEVIGKIKKHKNISLQIFATDLDCDAIEKARRGSFSKNITDDVSPERIKRFFKSDGDNYSIIASIREMIVFAPQNVIKDPPFTKLNILMCRNMLIYMESKLQQKLIKLFNYSLIKGGIMVLGTSETLGNHTEGFDTINEKLKLFKRTSLIMEPEFRDFPSSFSTPKTLISEKSATQKSVENIQTYADQLILQNYAPASVLVNNEGDILYITGRTGKYLEPVAGKANWNIYAMAREGLRQVLPGAFRKAKQNFEPVILHNIKIGPNSEGQYVDVTVQAIEEPVELRDMVMVIFSDMDIEAKSVGENTKKTSGKNINQLQKELEIELQRSYEELQSTREEMQTSQEELKSTNEELQSTNEEMQSTNEELTTSKEEMQSLNEELQTVNVELQSKISDLIRANDDMKNLLNSTNIATLFLDKELNIRRYTEQLTNIFKIRSTDVGRPFTDLVTELLYPEIDKHAKRVLRTLESIETAVATNDDRWFNIRIMPYRTLDDRIDGLVITFTNITASKKLEIELKKANEALLKR